MQNASYNTTGITGENPVQSIKKSEYSQFISNISSEDTKKKILDYIHEETKWQYGWFSNLFGTERNASKNITFTLLLIILIIFFVLAPFIEEKTSAKNKLILDIIKELLPLFTLGFGYFFGKQ